MSEKNYEPPRDCSRSWDRNLKSEVFGVDAGTKYHQNWFDI